MSEIKKHCDTCRYSYRIAQTKNRLEQHCSNAVYNSPEYTHKMLMEDWDQGYCRLWEPKEMEENHEGT